LTGSSSGNSSNDSSSGSSTSIMLQLPIEKRATATAARLSSSAALFVPRWCSVAQPKVFTGCSADAGNLDMAQEASPPNNQVNLYLPAYMPAGVAMQAAESTCTPSPSMGENHSEVETTKEETEVDADSSTTGGLQDVELHDSGENMPIASTVNVKDALQLERLLSTATYGDQTPSLYDSPRCYPDDPSVFLPTPNESVEISDPHGFEDVMTAESLLPPTPLDSLGHYGHCCRMDCESASEPSPSIFPGLVVVQVPLQLQCDANAPLARGPAGADVAVLSQEMDAKTGAMALHVRVVLSPPGVSPKDFLSTCMPQQQPPQESATSAAQRRARVSPGATAAKKRDMVCCHWKTKGWCRYEDSCGFMHPEGKRGMGGATVEETVDFT